MVDRPGRRDRHTSGLNFDPRDKHRAEVRDHLAARLVCFAAETLGGPAYAAEIGGEHVADADFSVCGLWVRRSATWQRPRAFLPQASRRRSRTAANWSGTCVAHIEGGRGFGLG